MKTLTVEKVKEKVKIIKDASIEDYESAHSLEDKLYIEVLKDISKGNPDAPKLAKAALAANKIKFPRWYA